MLRRVATLSLAALLIFPALTQAASWKIDPNHSSTRFEIRHLFSKVQGDFTQFSGTLDYDPANPTAAKVETKIDAASINTNNEHRDGDLKSENFFDVTKYPDITFTSTKVEKVDTGLKVTGDLTMHGVTKPVVMDVDILGVGPHPMIKGGQVAGFSAHTKVDRKDFGIIWNKTLDGGSTLLGDDVDITLNIEAVNAPSKPENPNTPPPAKSGN